MYLSIKNTGPVALGRGQPGTPARDTNINNNYVDMHDGSDGSTNSDNR